MSLGKSEDTERKESVGIKDLCQHWFGIVKNLYYNMQSFNIQRGKTH